MKMLATEILTRGGTEQDVADVLGISPAIVRKHYAKWTPARQERIVTVLKAVHGQDAFSGTKRKSACNQLRLQAKIWCGEGSCSLAGY